MSNFHFCVFLKICRTLHQVCGKNIKKEKEKKEAKPFRYIIRSSNWGERERERERERTSDGSIVAVVLKNLSKNDPSTENNKSPKWKGKLSLYNDGFNKIESNH